MTVYYSPTSTANILSYVAMVDAGHDVSYDAKHDRFVLRPAGNKLVLSFCRKNVSGSDNRLYCCNMGSMVSNVPTTYPQNVDHVMVGTAEENTSLYEKRSRRSRQSKRDACTNGIPFSQASDRDMLNREEFRHYSSGFSSR